MFHAWKNNQAFPVFLTALAGSRWVCFSKLLPGPGKSSTEVKPSCNLMPALVAAYLCKPLSQVPFSFETPSSTFIDLKPWLNSAWKAMSLGALCALMSASCVFCHPLHPCGPAGKGKVDAWNLGWGRDGEKPCSANELQVEERRAREKP